MQVLFIIFIQIYYLFSFKSGSEHPNSKSVTIDGVTYESLSSASKTLKISRETIKKRYF